VTESKSDYGIGNVVINFRIICVYTYLMFALNNVTQLVLLFTSLTMKHNE